MANPDYFRGKPKLDSVTFKIVPDANAILAQLNTGELSFTRGTSPAQFTGLDTSKVDVVKVDRVFEPSSAARTVYRPMYREYRRLYGRLHSIYARLNQGRE